MIFKKKIKKLKKKNKIKSQKKKKKKQDSCLAKFLYTMWISLKVSMKECVSPFSNENLNMMCVHCEFFPQSFFTDPVRPVF